MAVFVDGKMVGVGPQVRVPASRRTYQVFAVIHGAMKRVQVRYPEQQSVELK